MWDVFTRAGGIDLLVHRFHADAVGKTCFEQGGHEHCSTHNSCVFETDGVTTLLPGIIGIKYQWSLSHSYPPIGRPAVVNRPDKGRYQGNKVGVGKR